MLKKWKLWVFGLCAILAASGCATGRNYQADIDALNAKVSALQGQLSAKDEELASLRSEAGMAAPALARAESENRALAEKLSDALAKLEAAGAAKKTEKKRQESDLK